MEIINVGEPAQRQWVPVAANSSNTLYEGQVVTMGTDGVIGIGQASGAWNTTSKTTYPALEIPYGIVIGTSNRWEQYDTTVNTQKITSLTTSNANFYPAGREMAGIEGGWGQDRQAYVYVERIFPWTVLKAPIYFTSLGTAPTVATVASGASSTGMGYTTAATIGFTSIASLTTAFCRSGANKGMYRVTSDTSTTVKTVTSPFPFAIAVGDTFVHVNLKSFGTTRIQLDANAMFILGDAAVSSDYYQADVFRLSLAAPGKEYLSFRFGAFNFMPALA